MLKNPWLLSVLIIFRKEWRDAVRDKRAMRLAFLPALYFVGIFVGGILFTLSIQKDYQVDGVVKISLPVQGGEYLPELLDWLTEQGADMVPVVDDVYKKVEDGTHDFALIIPADVKDQKIRGETLTIWMVYNAANQKVHSRLGFVRAQINAWSARTGSLNLLARGIAPDVGTTLMLRESNVADDQKMGIYILGGLPMILLLATFVGSIGFSADMTAGERERRSLESLLITPTASLAFMVGKWLTSLLLTLSVLFVTLLLLWIALANLPFNQLGLRVDVGWLAMASIFSVLLPIALLAVALQLAVAIFARSFKDAQTYVGLLMFIPMVPGFYTLMNPGVYESWFLWVPILGQQVVIRDLFLGGNLTGSALIQFWLVSLVTTTLLLTLAARQLRRAKIIYG
jgi:sodium transport system permease protein